MKMTHKVHYENYSRDLRWGVRTVRTVELAVRYELLNLNRKVQCLLMQKSEQNSRSDDNFNNGKWSSFSPHFFSIIGYYH